MTSDEIFNKISVFRTEFDYKTKELEKRFINIGEMIDTAESSKDLEIVKILINNAQKRLLEYNNIIISLSIKLDQISAEIEDKILEEEILTGIDVFNVYIQKENTYLGTLASIKIIEPFNLKSHMFQLH